MGQLATPENILVLGLEKPQNRKYVGKRLAEIARAEGKHWLDAAMDLILSERQSIGTVYFMMSEENVKLQLRQPWIKFGTDAEGLDPEHPPALTHPRAYGTFPRILGKYVRDEQVIPLEEAIRKMTSAVAARLSIRDRGLLARGVSRRRRDLRPRDDRRPGHLRKARIRSPSASATSSSTARRSSARASTPEPSPARSSAARAIRTTNRRARNRPRPGSRRPRIRRTRPLRQLAPVYRKPPGKSISRGVSRSRFATVSR